MRRQAARLRGEGTVGFVPTMGYLHEGHLSLVRLARRACHRTVVSIFVNPAQFGPGEDLGRYPRDENRDRRLLRREGVDVLFAPGVAEMYPEGHATEVTVKGLTRPLCGRFRPGHFTGVTTVVAKLLNIVCPDTVVFGQKDAQQAVVVRRMVRDLDFGTKVVVGPTVREPDGLAMSSRNAYLSKRHRRQAPVLHRALELARGLVEAGETSPAKVKRRMRRLIDDGTDARVQYIEMVDTERLDPVKRLEGEVLVALAASFGRTRLIDNTVIRVRG